MDKELALDDENLRKLNKEKMINSFENVGNFFKEGKSTAKFFKWYIIMVMIIVSFIMGISLSSLVYKYSKISGYADTILGIDGLSQKYICSNSPINASFPTPKQALDFKELFPNASCIYISLKK